MKDDKSCPECLSIIPQEAHVCKFCSNRVEGVTCPACASICKAEAKLCKYCGTPVDRSNLWGLDREVAMEATFWGTFLSGGGGSRLIPQRAIFSTDKIVVTTYGFLGFSKYDDEIPWVKVAGFQHKQGVFWSSIVIETRGQSAAVISGLTHADAARIKAILQELEN